MMIDGWSVLTNTTNGSYEKSLQAITPKKDTDKKRYIQFFKRHCKPKEKVLQMVT